MKIIKVMRLLALTLVAVTVTHTSFAAERIYPSLDENLLRDEVAVATAIAEIKIKEAQKIINDTRQQALQGKVIPAAAIKIIKEQNAIIESIESALKNKIESAVVEVKKADEQNYLSSFVSGVQDLGSRAIAPFKSGYGYTPEQKATAQKVIDGLMEQQSQLTKDYEKALQAKLTPVERTILQDRYKSIIAELNEDIRQQQLITGAVMSTERKLFWGAVAAGAAVAGMYLLAPGTEITPKVVEEIKDAVVTTPGEPKTQPVEPAAQVIPAENATTSNLPGKPSLADVMNLNENEEEVLTQPVTPGNDAVTSDSEITPEEIQKVLDENDMELIREEKESLFNLLDEVAADKILREGEDTRDETEKQLRDFKNQFDEQFKKEFSDKGAPAVNEMIKKGKELILSKYKEAEELAKAEGEQAIVAKAEERALDEEVIGMESAYNDTKNLFNNFVDETKAFLEKKISLGDEKARETLQGLEERIAASDVDSQLAGGRNLDEIREDLEGAIQELQNAKRILEEQGLDASKQDIKSIESGEKLREDGQETIEEQPKKESLDGSSTEEDAVVKGYGKISRTEEEEVVLMKLRDGLYEELGDYSDELRALLKKADESNDPLIRNTLYNKIAKQKDGFWVVQDSYLNRLNQADNPEKAYVQLLQELKDARANFNSETQQAFESIKEINEEKELLISDYGRLLEKLSEGYVGDDREEGFRSMMKEFKDGTNFALDRDITYHRTSKEDILDGLREQRAAIQKELERLAAATTEHKISDEGAGVVDTRKVANNEEGDKDDGDGLNEEDNPFEDLPPIIINQPNEGQPENQPDATSTNDGEIQKTSTGGDQTDDDEIVEVNQDGTKKLE